VLTVVKVLGAILAGSFAIALALGKALHHCSADRDAADEMVVDHLAGEFLHAVDEWRAAGSPLNVLPPFGPVQIEGTPLAQTAFDRSWSDWGRDERVRDAHAAHLAELEAEHDLLRGRDERSGE